MKVKQIITIFVMCFVLVVSLGFSAEEETNKGPASFELDPFLIQALPGGNFYPFFLENYAPDTTLLIEENNAFSLIDNPRVYFEGDSFVDFNWYFNGFNLNSSLNDGSPALMVPFSAITAFRLQGESPVYKDNGLNIISDIPSRDGFRVMASTVYTDMGGYGAIGKFMIQPDHPSDRADKLYNERRKMLDNYFVDVLWAKNFNRSNLMLSVNYFDIKRQFNDFNEFDTVFEETGKILALNGRFRKELNQGRFELFGIYNNHERSALGAEIAAYPQETTEKKRNAFMAGIHLQKKKLDLKLSAIIEDESLTPHERNFSKDLVDPEGDGFYPYSKLGDFSASTFNVNIRFPVQLPMSNEKVRLNVFADARYSRLSGKEDIHGFNAISFDENPYLVLLWNKGVDYHNVNADVTGGIRLAVDLSKDISLLGKLFATYNYLDFDYSDNNINFLTPGFDAGLLLFKNKRANILFSYGRIPYDIRENVNSFLETNRPNGVYHHWEDNNGDLSYQSGEEGDIFGYSGGAYHFLDEDIKAPIKERLLLHFSYRFSRNYSLNIKAIYKKIKNHFRVKFKEEYGFYESYDGYDIHFYDQPFRDYYLTNNYLEKDPFYAAFHFNIKGRKENKWFFAFSFLAHMGMGDTAFGNGPGSNDIGILSESQADPNAWINGFGRVDGDRGFVAKSYFGFYLFKDLFVSFSLKYRDGNPFAFIKNLSRYDQYVLYYKTIKAEDEKGKKGGPREDYLADVSIKLNYRFRLLGKQAVLSLSFFNILDFGGELSEYVFSGGTRDALELQIPRSLRLTLNWAL